MLRIDRATYDAIVAHARDDHPDEACGVVAGPEGSDRPERFIPMLNAARSPTFYEFDSGDLLRLYREMDDRDEEPVVIYHSHTATEAYPSRTDIGLASGAERALRAGLHPGPRRADRPGRRRGRVPQLPHRRRRGERGGGRGRRVLPLRPLADHRRLRLKRHRCHALVRNPARRSSGVGADQRIAPLRRRAASPDIPVHEENRTPWPSRSGSRPSCAPTPAATRPSRAAAPRSARSSTTSTAKHPGLKNRLVTEEGKLHRFVNVYVNDEDVRFTGALDTQVKDGDSVTILPAVAGG